MHAPLRSDEGYFVQIDGIDGAGKSTLLSAARTWGESQGLRVFDAVTFCQTHHRLPTVQEMEDADMLLTAEPTHAWIGSAIRNEIIQRDSPYDTELTALAFALDRAVHYRRVIAPFLEAKPRRWVIFDRGLITSLAYQPLQSIRMSKGGVPVTVDWLLTLHGNKIALEYPPDIFVFLDIDPVIAQERLRLRTDKQDNVKFEEAAFQAELASRYHHPEVTQPLTSRGTAFLTFDGQLTKEALAHQMHLLLTKLRQKVFVPPSPPLPIDPNL